MRLKSGCASCHASEDPTIVSLCEEQDVHRTQTFVHKACLVGVRHCEEGLPAAYASATALTWALAVSCVVADAKALAVAWALFWLSADATALALALAAALAACMP